VREFLTSIDPNFVGPENHLPGRPDFVYLHKRKIILVHGCFWHRHTGCRRTTHPKKNEVLWVSKFNATINRDKRNLRLLTAQGWEVLVVWECEVLRDCGHSLVHRIREFVNGVNV